jgi:hypothetical protein
MRKREKCILYMSFVQYMFLFSILLLNIKHYIFYIIVRFIQKVVLMRSIIIEIVIE